MGLQSTCGTDRSPTKRSHWLLAGRTTFAVGSHAQVSHQNRVGAGNTSGLEHPQTSSTSSLWETCPHPVGVLFSPPTQAWRQVGLSLSPSPHVNSTDKHPALCSEGSHFILMTGLRVQAPHTTDYGSFWLHSLARLGLYLLIRKMGITVPTS